MKRSHLVGGDTPETGIGANRQVRVRVLSVDEPQERPFGDGGGDILQLTQAIEPQLADARELALLETWPRHQVGQQPRAARREPGQRGQREVGRITADVHVVVGTDSRERIGHLDRAQRAGALIRHVGNDGGKTLEPVGIGA
jgi:hypothetical protein